MIRPACVIGAALAMLATGGCGGAKGSGGGAEQNDFDCRNRRMAYIATGHFAGPEVGVVVDCAERGPRIKRWVVMEAQTGEQAGEAGAQAGKQTNQHSLSPREFDQLWEKFDSTGWRMLGDCNNPTAAEGDPSYKFGIQDHNGSVSLACAGRTLPFPFDRMLNELDLLVAQYGL